MKSVKNYTSEVPASTSMAKIDDHLVEIGASNISKAYNDKKICTGITFLLYDERMKQTIAFHLTAQVEATFKILMADIKKPISGTKERVLAQANRTAWKILLDWTEVQCAMIKLGQAEPLQMFLPFVYDIKKQETFYQKVVSGNIKLLT